MCTQVHVELVGLDINMIVEGRELVGLKLQGVKAHVHSSASGPGHPDAYESTSARLTIDDMVVEDLQVQPTLLCWQASPAPFKIGPRSL